LQFLLWLTNQGFPLDIAVFKTGHTNLGSSSAHFWGEGVDIQNYNSTTPLTNEIMRVIRTEAQSVENAKNLRIRQLIGPNKNLVFPLGIYDAATLAQHKTHLHVGFPYHGHTDLAAPGTP
jgi:hypothetical protein